MNAQKLADSLKTVVDGDYQVIVITQTSKPTQRTRITYDASANVFILAIV
jgi:hypothetical protein